MNRDELLDFAQWLTRRIPNHSGDPQLAMIRRKAHAVSWMITHPYFYQVEKATALEYEVKQYRPALLVAWRLSQ